METLGLGEQRSGGRNYAHVVVPPEGEACHLVPDQSVMVWRRSWAERNRAWDCEAQILSEAFPGAQHSAPNAASTPPTKPNTTNNANMRHQVRYLVDSTTHPVRACLLIPVLRPDLPSPCPTMMDNAAGSARAEGGIPPTVLICGETGPYRRQCWAQPRPGDYVVEIGSSYGKATGIIAKQCTNVLGIDIARSLVGRLRKSFPQLRFECFNPLTERQRLLDLARGCTILFVDIGGNRHLETVLELVTLAKKHLMPHLIVVKSKELKNKAYAYLEQHGLLGKIEELPDSEVWWDSLAKQDENGTIAATKLAKLERRLQRANGTTGNQRKPLSEAGGDVVHAIGDPKSATT